MSASIKCKYPDCGAVFRSQEELIQHWADEWDENKSHDFCPPCKYMAKDWDDLTDHKANSPRLHMCCKFCGQEFKALKTRNDHIRKMHAVQQDLRCIGCKEHFVRGYALVAHLEFDHCVKIKASQFKTSVEHKALINKLLEDPDYVRKDELNIDSTASATASSTHAGEDFDDSSTIGGASTTAAESSHILDEEDEWSVVDSQEGGVRIQPLVPVVTSQVQSVQRPAEQFPALPGRENVQATPRTTNVAVATPPRGVEDFPALPGSKNGATMTQLSGATSQLSVVSSTATDRSPWKNSSDAWETSSQASEVLFRGTGTASVGAETTAGRLFNGAESTPMNAAWKKSLAERDLEYDDRNRCNPFLLRFWDPEHPEYDPERFFHTSIGKYICPLKKCVTHFFEPSKMTEHLMAKHIITQVRCPTCLKLFNSCSAMLAHSESTGSECRVAYSDKFGEVVDMWSGGFLAIVDARRDDVTAEDLKDRKDEKGNIVKDSGMRDGYIKYIATVPNDWAGAGSEAAKKGITVGRSWDDGSAAPRRQTGTVNPSVPISNSCRLSRTTASIYPELVYYESEASGPLPTTTTPSARITGKGKGKYKPANHLIDQDARRDPTGIYVVPEEFTVMPRSNMKYNWEQETGKNGKNK